MLELNQDRHLQVSHNDDKRRYEEPTMIHYNWYMAHDYGLRMLDIW